MQGSEANPLFQNDKINAFMKNVELWKENSN
jgi:hypothetical protein